MIEEWKLAYAAGLIDGEGCIEIRSPRKYKHGGTSYSMHVSVAMTDLAPIEFLSINFGSVVEVKKTRTSTGRIVYRWSLTSHKAKNFLILIQPYIIGKTRQVDTVLAFPLGTDEDGRQLYGRGTMAVPWEVQDLREICFDLMRELKSPLLKGEL